MGQVHPKKKCIVQAIWMTQGFWEYSIPIHDLPEKDISSLVLKFQQYGFNHFIVNYKENLKILTVYIPEEHIFTHIFQYVNIPFQLNKIIHHTSTPSAPPIDISLDPTNI